MVDDVGGVTVTARLYVKSSEVMDEVRRKHHLTITSQPYWNAIDYDRHADDPDAPLGYDRRSRPRRPGTAPTGDLSKPGEQCDGEMI